MAGGNDVRIRSIGGLHMVSARIGNNLYIEAMAPVSGESQGVRNNDGWEVQGWTQIEAAGQDVVLTADHQFVGAVSINARNVIINDIDDIVLGHLNITGSLTVIGGGNITLAAGGAVVVAGLTTLTATQAINLGGTGNNFNGLAITQAQSALITDLSGLNLAGVNVGGNFSLSAAGDITDSGATAVGGGLVVAAGAGSVTLDAGLRATGNASISGGAISLGQTTAGGDLSVTAGGAVLLASGAADLLSVAGNFVLSAGGAVSDTGAVQISGTTTVNASAQAVTLDSVRNDFTGTLSLTAGSASLTDANSLSLSATVAGTLALNTGSALSLGTTFAADLSMTAGGVLTDTGALTVSGTTTLSLGGADATLDHAGNNLGTLVVSSARHLSLTDSSGLVLGGSALGGDLALRLGGALTQAASADLTVGGSTSITTHSGQSITLDNMNGTQSRNDFVGAVTIVSGNHVSLSDLNALNLGASSISGNLSVTSAGLLSDSGALLIGGSLSLDAGSSDIVLDNGNTLGGSVSVVSARNLSLSDSNALSLGDVTLSGNLILMLGGTLSQSSGVASLKVAGSSEIGVASGSDVLLGNSMAGGALNRFGGTVSVDSGARDVSLSSDVALDLGNITASRDLSVLANAAVSDTGRLNIGGHFSVSAASAAATPVAQNIVIDGNGHAVSGTFSVSGAQVTLRENAAMQLGVINASGNLTLTAAGAITGSSAITAGAGTRIDAAGYAVSLSNAGNNFTGTVTVVSAASITLADVDALSFAGAAIGASADLSLTAGGVLALLGNVSSDRDMTLNASSVQIGQTTVARHLIASASSGAITQNAETALRVGGSTTLSAQTLTLAHASNSFTGAVSLLTSSGAVTGHVSLRSAGALQLGASSVQGNLSLQADGAITQSGALQVQGTTNLAVGATNSVTLSNAGNDLTGALSVASVRNLTLSDLNALVLGPVSVSGNLSLTTASHISQVVGAALSVSGTSTLNSSIVGDIVLSESTNYFGNGVVIAQARNVTMGAEGGVHIISANVAANLQITSTLANDSSIGVRNSQVWVIGGNITINATGQNVTLTQPHDFQGVLSINANNATINDVNNLVLGTVVMSGNLQVSVGGHLSVANDGSLSVYGNTSLQAGGRIVLGDTTIGAFNAAANLSLIAGAADGISQDAGKLLKVYGSTSLVAGSAGIVLANANGSTALNDWVGLVSVASAGVVTLRDSNALQLAGSSSDAMSLTTGAGAGISLGTVTVGTSGAAANLSLSSGSGITQTSGSALTVYGSSNLSALTNITLANRNGAVALNDFVGSVHVAAAQDVQLADKNALGFAAQSVRSLDVAAAGALGLGPVTASGTLSASGNFTLTGNLSAQSLSLVSSAALNMAGYALTATDSAGSVLLRAQGDITLGRIRALNGDVTIDSLAGTVQDGLLSDERNVATGGAVSIKAGSTSLTASTMAVRLWSSLGTTFAADAPGTLDVMAASINDLSANSGVTVGIGSGSGSIFTGVLSTAGDLSLDLGSAGITMAAGSALRAGGNLSLSASGALTLAELSAGQVVSITTSAAITALSDVDTQTAANIKGATVLLSGAAIGSSVQALRIDAVGSGSTAGVIRLVNTPSTPTAGDAYLAIVTELNGSARRTVELGTSSDNWAVGGLLQLSASTANLSFKGNIIAGSVDIEAAQGSLTMSDGKTLQSTGNIELAGAAGVGLSRVVGSSTDASQLILVRSDAGLISDLSADELANISTAGDLRLSARAIGASGSADIDVLAARLHEMTATTGAVFLDALGSSQTWVGTVSAAGAFDLRVSQGEARLAGQISAGLINLDVAGHILQDDGMVMVTAGTASLRAGGDIALARLLGGNGSVTFSAIGAVLDASTSSAANIVMGTGSLSIEAQRIGAIDNAFDIDAGNITQIKANETSTSASAIHVSSTRFGDVTTLGRLETVGQAQWLQTTGHLALTGAVSASTLSLQVTGGDLRQSAGSLVVTSDLALQASGNMVLAGMSSTHGNIGLVAGGAILDGTASAEAVLLTTAAAGKSISLQAGSGIGLDDQSGDLEINTDALLLASTSQGGIYLNSVRSLTVHEVTAAEQASVRLSSGSLTLTGSTSGRSVQIAVAAGALSMQANAVVLSQSGVSLASAQGMDITRVLASGPNAQVSLSAGGLLRDASLIEPGELGGWNIEANGSVSLSALAIGEISNSFDVKTTELSGSANSAGAWLNTGHYDPAGGTIALTADAISGSGHLNMILLTGDLLISQSFSASTVDLQALSGSIQMSDGVVLSAVGNMNLVSGKDMVLSRLVTNTGRVTLTAGGSIIDGSSSELANVTGTQSGASLEMNAARIGSDVPVVDERQFIDLGGATGGSFVLSLTVDGVIRSTEAIVFSTGVSDTQTLRDARIAQALSALGFAGATYSVVSGEVTFGGSLQKRDMPTLLLEGSALTGNTSAPQIVVTQEGGVPGDINLNIARLAQVRGGAQGVYLQSERSLEMGSLSISGDLVVEVGSGDLVITASQSARNLSYQVLGGQLTMNDGAVATAAGSADLYAYRDLRLSRLVVAGSASGSSGDARVVSDLGSIIDNSSGEGLDQENIVVAQGSLTQLKGQSVGSRFVGSEIDVDAQRLGTVQASTGGAFVQVTGALGSQVNITEVLANGNGADVGLSVTLGGARVDRLAASDQISVAVEGAGTTPLTVALSLGEVSAGGDLTLSNSLGDIVQSGTSTFVRADGNAAWTRLSAGGDIVLSVSGNDFANLSITTARDAQVRDRDGLNLGSIGVSRDLALFSSAETTLLQGQSVQAGRQASLQVDSGNLVLVGTNTVQAQTEDLSIVLSAGGVTGLGSSTLRAGRDVLLQAQGEVGLGGTTLVESGRDVRMNIRGSLNTSGTTTVTATAGAVAIASTYSGNLNLAGTTRMTAATGLGIVLTEGQWTTATGSSTTLRTSGGLLSAALANGAVNWRGSTVLEGDSVSISVSGLQASLSANNATTISADAGDVALTLARGNVSLQGASTFTASRNLDLAILGAGQLAMAGASTLQAQTGDLSVDVAQGHVTFTNASTLRAGDDLTLKLRNGNWSASGASTLTAGGDVSVQVDQGLSTLTQRTVIGATQSLVFKSQNGISASGLTEIVAGQSASLNVVSGGVSFENTSQLRATAGNLNLAVATGTLRFTGDSALTAGTDQTLSANTGDVVFDGTTIATAGQDYALSIATGQLSFSGVSRVTAQRDLSVSVGVGDVTQHNTTSWTAGRDVLLDMGSGNLLSHERTLVMATRDVAVRIQVGDIGINDDSRWLSGQDQHWQISQAGTFVMEDAQTELQSGRDISLSVADDVRVDWMQAAETLRIQAVRGAILDNTAAETDLMAARHLALDAAKGIGLPWADNLNTWITGTLTANNRESGGINVQNWVGLTIGASGVLNRGDGNLILISGGTMNHGEVRNQNEEGLPNSVINPRGQKLFLIHNQSERYLLEQWGNRTISFVNVRTAVPESAKEPLQDLPANGKSETIATLIPTQVSNPEDAATRLLEWASSVTKTQTMSQPIRLADVLRDGGDGSRNPFGSDLLSDIRSMNDELQGARSLQAGRALPWISLDSQETVVPIAPQSDSGLDADVPQAFGTWPSSADLPPSWHDRPVLRQAMLLADDSLDQPLIEDEAPEAAL